MTEENFKRATELQRKISELEGFLRKQENSCNPMVIEIYPLIPDLPDGEAYDSIIGEFRMSFTNKVIQNCTKLISEWREEFNNL